ncbi:sensor domain-containing diguanylate cyclase [Sulfurimonas marina]|uniref:diguanylate cyclase n=1 Tax=Sulfurimonas marina TaxID=2590551 RepID=A0A7M1AZ72_9BACT|nr:diguanylate cyclase [Sulfurimonas marina]QOP41848.1 diguanylate cyclase [Sulfurimonas marina]
MIKKITFSLIIFIIFVYFLLEYLENKKKVAIADYNHHALLTTKATYNGVINTYEVAGQKDFNFLLHNDRAMSLLHSFKNSKSEKERNLLRGKLYRALYKSYDVMKSMDVRQFHLHTIDGKSLLRMNMPCENGDSIIDLRKSIQIVNREHKQVIGFEGGRLFSGYRYVFPIIDKGEYLGSAEFSIAFEGIEAKLSKLLPNSVFALIVTKHESYDKVFQWHRGLISVSDFDKNYYIENPKVSAITKRNSENKLVTRLTELVKKSPHFYEQLQQHKDFSIYIVEKGKGYAVNFISFINTDQKHAGYLISFNLQNEILDIQKDYCSYKLMAFVISAVVFILLFIILYQIEKLRKNRYKLQAINDSFYHAQKIAHFGSLSYDHKKQKFYLTDEVYKILGISADSFTPSYKAFLSLVHPDDRKKVHQAYRNSFENKTIYEINHRILQKDGSIRFVEEHGSHELDSNGEIIKTFGSLYDITEQIAAYENLERFIDLQSSIVILTDGKQFKFANKSFYHFFGFEDLKAFKEQYDCICERFIEHDGFFSLEDVKEDEDHWIESLLNLSKRQRIVSMLDSTATPHAFSVSINKYNNENYVVEFNDISDSMLEKLQLERQLNRDQLTSAHNRVYFETNIKNIMKLNEDNNANTGIVFFDIDHFKQINDTYGHDVGDDVLIALVQVVKEQTRNYDHLIRWGGEEFIIITRVESKESLQQMTEHIRVKIQNHYFKDISSLTCSFGLAIHKEGENIKQTITRADEKLYEAKENGRNQVRI